MNLESKKFLYDIRQAVDLIEKFLDSKTFSDYSCDPLLQSGVERQLIIVGEALNRLSKVDTSSISNFTDYKKIIGFRNIIVHGYDIVENETVWGIIQSSLPQLRDEVNSLLGNE